MRKLAFDYEMRLAFSAPVTDHRFQLRCLPATGPRQQIVDVEVELEPQADLDTAIDSFGSVVLTGFVPEPHEEFGYRVRGIAFVDTARTKPEPEKPLYRFDSALTAPGPCLERLIERCRNPLDALGADAEPVERAQVIMGEVHRALAYTPASTTVRTTAEEALAQGAGVCQDYAHVMLAVCRHAGLMARYIAGMLQGEGATHAWMEVYQDGRWLGLDPTHDRLVDDGYITIAHGRDYRDCMVDIGLFSSASGTEVRQTQWVNASVRSCEP